MQSIKPEYRVADENDLEAIITLLAEFHYIHGVMDERLSMLPESWPMVSKYYKEQLTSKETIYYLAIIENQVVGFISVKLQNRSPIFEKSLIGRIDTLIVTGKNRRSGIGTQLYELAKQWLKNQGINTLQISVASNNPTGIEFCKNIGFEELMIRMEKQI